MLGLRLAVSGLLVAVLAACSAPSSMNESVGGVPEELMAPRPKYDVSRPFDQLVRPHFFARSNQGELEQVQGKPDLIVEWQGKVKVRLQKAQQPQYLDLLALESELLGEHPSHKIFRLRAMGIPIADDLERKLRSASSAHRLFHTLDFEYLPGKEARGVIAEIFPDGTFLVIPFRVPEEWRSPSGEGRVAGPSHFHVNPRALSVGHSRLAKRFERKILKLPFEKQRYPSARLARQECGVYKESLQNKEYQSTLASVGYRFTPVHVVKAVEGQPPVFGEWLSALLWEGSGKGVQYFGFDRYWAAERLASLRASWVGECDAAGGVRRYRLKERPRDNFYITVRRSLERDKKDRYKIVSLGDDGSGQVIYNAPGIMLMARPLPWDDTSWIISTEGWTEPKEGKPADPRWQSVYVVNVKAPNDYHVVNYPLDRYPKPPKGGHLYGTSGILSPDGRFLFNILYGFKDEGGGVWVADLSEKEFYTKPDSFARIVAWDHALSWTVLEDKTDGPAPFMHVFMTGKEVADDFAMTANLLRIKNAGLDSAIQHQERLLQMVGWNPVPFALQRISEHEFRVGVETYFNYESSLLPRAEGVYLISVDTARNQ
jgi:hypothetical protein